MTRSRMSVSTASLLASVAATAFATVAHGQSAPLSGRDAPAASAGSVSEVVVTAQKREQRLLDTPVPVTALTPEMLQRAGAVSFEDYIARVPGFSAIATREGNTQLILRGITTGPQPNSTVGTYVDDTPFGSSSVFTSGGALTPDFDPSDLQRVEVLRGPQGTLYGANTLGGLLKFVTTPPDTTAYHARVEADGDTVAHGGSGYGVRAMVNLPLVTDKLALRANLFDREDPGFIQDPSRDRHDVDDTRVFGGRASLLWNASDKLTIRLTASGQNLKSLGAPEEDVDLTTLQPLYGHYQQKRYTDELLDNTYALYSANVSWNLGLGDFISSTSYSTLKSKRDSDVTTALGFVGGLLGLSNFGLKEPAPVDLDRFTEEARLVSHPGHFIDWQLGFYFDHERGDQRQTFDPFDTTTGAVIPLPNLALVTLQSRYTEYAGFGDVTLHFTPRFDIQGGVRYSSNSQHYSQGEGGLLAGGAFSTIVSQSSDDSTTFLVTPEFKVDANDLVYVRIASGYRPGGPNALVPAQLAENVPTSFAPDHLVNYEVGYKASLLDRRLTLDVSGFYIDWSDVQLLTRFGDFTVEGNGGSAVSKGFEGSATLTPLHGLTFSDNLSYTDAHLTQDALGAGGRKGDRLPFVPRFSNSLNADYDLTLMGLDAYVGASYRYVGDRTSAFATSALPSFVRPKLPSYDVVDLRAGINFQRFAVNLYVKNVGDSRGITDLSGLQEDPGQNPYAASLIQPRTFGAAISAQF